MFCGFSQSFTQGFSPSFTHPRVLLLGFYQFPSSVTINIKTPFDSAGGSAAQRALILDGRPSGAYRPWA